MRQNAQREYLILLIPHLPFCLSSSGLICQFCEQHVRTCKYAHTEIQSRERFIEPSTQEEEAEAIQEDTERGREKEKKDQH